MYVYMYMHVICVETYLERNCTATHMPAYMRPLISQESISRSAMKPTSQMTTKGVPSITFCLNSCGRNRGKQTDGYRWQIRGDRGKKRESRTFGRREKTGKRSGERQVEVGQEMKQDRKEIENKLHF